MERFCRDVYEVKETICVLRIHKGRWGDWKGFIRKFKETITVQQNYKEV